LDQLLRNVWYSELYYFNPSLYQFFYQKLKFAKKYKYIYIFIDDKINCLVSLIIDLLDGL